ncbi:hypothetical protein OIV54_32165, partial [Burkholderia pseudomallei]|uniref:hypothetical protein n=1 Tax=Burkholderia pseudomallei TaxID=28450 RepID=UPI0021F6BC6C
KCPLVEPLEFASLDPRGGRGERRIPRQIGDAGFIGLCVHVRGVFNVARARRIRSNMRGERVTPAARGIKRCTIVAAIDARRADILRIGTRRTDAQRLRARLIGA